jgi:signal transduction histidine kinase
VTALAASLEALIGRTMRPSIAMEMHWAPGLRLALWDSGRLETALLNLCASARDSMPEGGLLRVEAANAPLDAADADADAEVFGVSAGDYLRLAVADAGRGMPPEVCRRAAMEGGPLPAGMQVMIKPSSCASWPGGWRR